MQMKLQQVGQINEADITFGDITLFVGPQATGKSIALQFLKLMVDTGYVQQEMKRYGLDWSARLPEFFDSYFGEGMAARFWRENSSVVWWNGWKIEMPHLIGRMGRNKDESLFFIPAQRVLTMRDGWPRPFSDYSPGDPFAVREFSEKLRVLVEQEFGANEILFPQVRRLKKEFRELLERHVFAKFHLQIDEEPRAEAPGPWGKWGAPPLYGMVGRPARVCAAVTGTLLADAAFQDTTTRRY